MKTIDLGMSYDGPCEATMAVVKDSEPRKHYPSFHYEGDEDLGLPKEGTMTVKFKKVGSSRSERGDKTQYSCTVEVHDIVDVGGERDERPARSHDESSAVLDKLMAEKMAGKRGKSGRY
jgi:hypothetical protein